MRLGIARLFINSLHGKGSGDKYGIWDQPCFTRMRLLFYQAYCISHDYSYCICNYFRNTNYFN